jgi:excisionase family DNA binding protein
MLFIFVPVLTKEKTERYKVKTSNKDILKRIDALENLLKKHPVNANRQTGKPMTFKETCAYLGYAPSYLYKLTYKNIIPHHKPTGKMLYFFKDEIDEWIAKSSN